MSEAQDAVRGLSALLGEWESETVHQSLPSMAVRGRATFEWLEGETFLIMRARLEHPDFPDFVAVIGGGDELRFHYFDSRGVARVYQMGFVDGVWSLWRDSADFTPLDFSQRFSGTLSGDSQTIDGAWEIAHDGTTWEHDLRVTYRRVA